MMRTVYLEGELADKFIPKFTVDASSPREVLKCLELNFPTFRKYLIDCHDRNIGFTCQIAEDILQDERELLLQYGKGDMILTAVPSGSKGAGKVFAAVVMAVIILSNPSTFFVAEGGAAATSLKTAVGLSLKGKFAVMATLMVANMGMAEMMAPDPQTDNSEAADENYLYQGTNQVGKVGDPVPLLYGRLKIPGKPIGINQSNITRAKSPVHTINGDSLGGNGYISGSVPEKRLVGADSNK